MSDLKWDDRFLKLAEEISTWSKDPSTQCGAVIVDQQNRIISTGYNGFPQKINDNPMHLVDRKKKYEKVIHAEMNAILFANRDLTGCTLYVHPLPPCSRCAVIIIQSGITRVVSKKPSPEHILRWGDSLDLTYGMFHEANIEILNLR